MAADWAETTVGDLLEVEGGGIQTGPFGTKLKASEYTEKGVPVISVGEVQLGRLVVHSRTPKVDSSVTNRMPEYLLEQDDIVFGRKGAVERSAIVSRSQRGWFLGSDGIRLRLPKVVNPKFVAYQFLSESHKTWMVQHAAGTTMASLNEGIIRRIPIMIAPVSEQNIIAHILGTLDEKIELNRQMNATLEAMAQALFKSWFVDFDPVIDNALAAGNAIPEPLQARAEARATLGDQRKPLPELIQRQLPSSFVFDEELGWVPEGWPVTSLAETFSKTKGVVKTGPFGSNLHASDYAETGSPLILVKHVMNGIIALDELPLVNEEKAESLQDYWLEEDDIVVTRVGRVGSTAIVPKFQAGWMFSGQMLRVRLPDGPVSARWLAYWFRTPHFTHAIESYAVGSTRASLNTKILESLQFVLPPVAIQNYFGESVEANSQQVNLKRIESQTLKKLRDTLLPRLLSGEVRIPHAEKRIADLV